MKGWLSRVLTRLQGGQSFLLFAVGMVMISGNCQRQEEEQPEKRLQKGFAGRKKRDLIVDLC